MRRILLNSASVTDSTKLLSQKARFMSKIFSKPLIVPLDFSEASVDALKTALEMIESPDMIEVIHVTPRLSAADPGVVWGGVTEVSVVENLSKSFKEICDKEGFPELKFSAVFGDPGSSIAEFAKEKDAGLVVISSHGRTGIRRLLLGSVAERVVRLAPCPVLVLRDDDHGEG